MGTTLLSGPAEQVSAAVSIPRPQTPDYGPGILGLVSCLALVGVYLSRLTQSVVDLDIFHAMALARESLRLGYIPDSDLFAYTPTLARSIHHEWGAGFVAWFLASRLGPAGIVLLKCLLASVLAALCVLTAKSRGGTRALIIVAGIPAALLAGIGFSPVRAQMYSFVFTALLLYFLRLDERGSRRWILPWLAVFVLWVNIHAGFVVGLGFLGVHWLEQALRRRRHVHLLGVMLAMVGLIAMNPYGIHYYHYLWTALTMPRPEITEWGPLWRCVSFFYTQVFVFACILVVCICSKVRFWNLPHLGIVAATAIAAAIHAKMVPFFALVFICYVPSYLRPSPLGRWIERWLFRPSPIRIAAWGGIAIFFLVTAFHLHFWILRTPGDRQAALPPGIVFPVGPVEYLAGTQFAGNVTVPFEQGAFVSWKLYPRVRVSFDSRYEAAYPDWLANRMFRFYRAEPGWRDTLAAYPTDVVLVRGEQPLARAMHETQWKRIYTDRTFQMYARPSLRLPAVDWSGRTFEGVFP